jgi:hypothetical protein
MEHEMPTVTSYSPLYIPGSTYTRRTDGSVCRITNGYADQAGCTIKRTSNDVQKRTKPGNLLENLTSLPKQSTSIVWKGIYRFKSSSATRTTCNPNIGNEYVYTTSHYPFPGPYAEVGIEEPDWVTPLRLKMQSDKLSLADTLGEWREAVKLVEDSAGFFKRAATEAKEIFRSKRKIRQAAKSFKRLFKRRHWTKWELKDYVQVDLLIKFGIKPTAQLLWDIGDTLNKIQFVRRRYQVSLRRDVTDTLEADPGYTGTLRTQARRSVRAIAYVTYNMDNPAFTTGNLAESLWAGTSLSFMVDWFWNFGGYLSSFNAMNGVKSFKGVVGNKILIARRDNRTAYVSGGTRTTVQPARSTFKSYERTVMLGLPLASLPEVKPLSESVDWSKLISAREVLFSMRQSRRALTR